MSKLDEQVKKHDDDCYKLLMRSFTNPKCDCGADEAADELANLKEYGNEWQQCAQEKDKQLAQLRAVNADVREAATNLINQLNHVYENREYLTAWTLYDTHFGNYKKNGGEQWTKEQDALTAVLAKHPKARP